MAFLLVTKQACLATENRQKIFVPSTLSKVMSIVETKCQLRGGLDRKIGNRLKGVLNPVIRSWSSCYGQTQWNIRSHMSMTSTSGNVFLEINIFFSGPRCGDHIFSDIDTVSKIRRIKNES